MSYEPAVRVADQLLEERVVSRIWKRDTSVWSTADGSGSVDAQSIAARLGWLDVSATMAPHLDHVIRVGDAMREELVEAVYLLGMGGSSLCAEVLRAVYGVADGYPELFVLDTTDERTIVAAASRLTPVRTRFIVASKSGGTLEVASLERFFWERMRALRGEEAGGQFVAISDPGTALLQLARERRYREIFENPPDIGGRFSALSLFGLVPAACIGAPARDIHAAAEVMAEGCRQENHANAGLELGAFIGAAANAGRDKLTVVLPPSLTFLGLWIEQLIAESTGKHGTGALPVVDEFVDAPAAYRSDRAFVAITTDRDAPDASALSTLEAAGHPVLRLTTRLDGLGSEFFRWEFATAVAGAVLGVNPFDEPNVAEAKQNTKALLNGYAQDGRLPEPPPAAEDASFAVYTNTFTGATTAAVVRAALDSLGPDDYVAFLSYLSVTPGITSAVAHARLAIRQVKGVASTFGVGPRYLHSTGQYHKGGPNTVVAFVLTAGDETETPIPDAGYSFSVLKRAQALADVETLAAHGRRTVRIHFKDSLEAAPAGIERLFAEALKDGDTP
ncbi:MAG: glucose-6-phosphate isomerase [Acidobacteria bacterium]|nr:glucose-6-phosphate isomerase [Acidobacteriota bacterium]MCA1649183.1 glucose-6-phosphate isomerase [Acidobacteriota bacterium]